MNSSLLEGKWDEVRGKIQQKWSRLTDDEVGRAKGSWNELSGIIQQRYGKTRDAVSKEIEDFEKELKRKLK